MRLFIFLSFLFSAFISSSQEVGGGCQGCEAIFEYGNKHLTSVDTLPLFESLDPKILIKGTVFQNDGRTPAAGVVLYFYQTNREGIYQKEKNANGRASRHGFIRGWVKTDSDGSYQLFTFRPASYPSRTEAEHIHITVKEPGLNEYYIDSIVFDDDPLLTSQSRAKLNNRGGSGLVELRNSGDLLVGNRDIILGESIPNYPQ